jgi:DtxR family transcriptional regulator, Mn-dependent transcriptional regulator
MPCQKSFSGAPYVTDKTMESTKPSQTIEDYLSLLFVLERDGEPIVGARLAELLGVSAPTVTNTLKRMARDGFITMHENGTHLTEQGWQLAQTVVRRHMLMEWMMLKMLPWSKLHGEAHSLEHAVSHEAEAAIYEELGRPKTCPHGNPLPGCEDAVAAWIPLPQILPGAVVTIRRIHELAEENRELLAFLEEKGIIPDVRVTIGEVLAFNQTITIMVREKPVTLGFSVAKYIYAQAG